jgi:hypothetical protein
VINYVVGSRSPKTKVTPTGTEIPPLAFEAIVDLYSKDVDRSLIQENLRLGFVERLKRAQANAQGKRPGRQPNSRQSTDGSK